MSTFTAFRIHADKSGTQAKLERLTLDDLNPGEVVIRAAWSNINYKDALAATGKGKILRTSPLVGGVDVAGYVESSTDARFNSGDSVMVCGCGLSELYDGGYSEIVRVKAEFVVPVPEGLDLREAMAIGTAGFSAAMAIQRMQDNGQTPENGIILVTGATGGVASFAIDMLSSQGYDVAALTGKPEHKDYLQSIGATQIVNRHELEMGTRPMEQALWGGAIDNVGGDTLAWLTRTVKPWGNIASIGLAGGYKLETTVMPFILRGISLLGVNSVDCTSSMREKIWHRISSDLRPQHLEEIITAEITLDELSTAFDDFMNGQHQGRTIVKINP
jgi:NADPH2:quinone reductase